MTPDERCVTQNMSGISHDYRKCMNDYEDTLDERLLDSADKMNLDGPKAVMSSILTYATSFTGNPAGAIKKRCKGILGNQYFIELPIKCSNLPDKNIHRWVNNVQSYNPLTGKTSKTPLGLLPSIVGSMASIKPSALLNAITDKPNKPCIEVPLPCHVIYFKQLNDDFTKNLTSQDDSSLDYSNRLSPKPITLEQFDEILYYGNHKWSDKEINEFVQKRNEIEEKEKNKKQGFTNINNEDSIYKSIYKYLESNSELLNNHYDDNTIKNDKVDTFNNEIIFDIYYIILFAFLIFLLLKITNKK